MEQEEFAALVHRMEAESSERPFAYKARVLALAVLPYFYVFGALLLALGLIGLMVAGLVVSDRAHGALLKLVVKGSWAIGLVVFAILRALWVRAEFPEVQALDPAEYPTLFAEIESVRKEVGAPMAHVVTIDDEYNAAISQHSRLGLLGWQKNYLYLGLPLMRALSPEQFRAVLAHEFGHLAGAHGRAGAWIYRNRKRWGTIQQTFEEDEHWASFVFRPFLRWYAPYFNATSFVRARSAEYEADRAAADATSARVMGDALCALGLRNRQLDEEHWGAIRKRMDEVPEPDVRPHSSMRVGALLPETAKSWLLADLETETGIADTHPSLTDRLASLGVDARVPAPPEPSAAEAWLDAQLPKVAAGLDAEWREWIGDRWTQHYESLHARRARLDELDAKARDGGAERSADEIWEHAELVEDLRTPSEALPLYQQLIAANAEHAGANFAVGRILIAQGDEAGIPHIERAIARTETAIIPGCEWVVPFLREAGRDEEAAEWEARWKAHQEKLDEDEKDREKVWFDEHYCEPHVTDEARQDIVDHLASLPEVERAWLLRRKTLHFPECAMHVLIVRRKGQWQDWFSDEKEQAADAALHDTIAQGPGLGGDYLILVTNGLARKHRNRLEGFEDTLIFDRSA